MSFKLVENQLRVYWSKKEKDLVYSYPLGSQTKADGHLLHIVMGCDRYDHEGNLLNSFFKELADRGYDLQTLKFIIAKKTGHSRWAPSPNGTEDNHE